MMELLKEWRNLGDRKTVDPVEHLTEWISNNPDKDVSSLEYVDLYSEDITLFYKQKVFKNPYDRFNKEYLIRLYLFNKWYKKWQFVN